MEIRSWETAEQFHKRQREKYPEQYEAMDKVIADIKKKKRKKRNSIESKIEMVCEKCSKKQKPDDKESNENWRVYSNLKCECGGRFIFKQ